MEKRNTYISSLDRAKYSRSIKPSILFLITTPIDNDY